MERLKRQYFICHGTSKLPVAVVQAATGADVVYYKDYEHGVLYSLYFKHENRKQHSTVENLIERLDSMLMTKNNTTRTHFTSLTETGKVKSFSGRDRHDDYHFCEIFDVNAPKLYGGKQYQTRAHVTTWSRNLEAIEEGEDKDEYKHMVHELIFDESVASGQHEDDLLPEAVAIESPRMGEVIAEQRQIIKTQQEKIDLLENEQVNVSQLNIDIENLREQVEAKRKEIAELKQVVAEKTPEAVLIESPHMSEVIAEQRQIIKTQQEKIDQLEDEQVNVYQLNIDMDNLREQVEAKTKEIEELQQLVAKKTQTIERQAKEIEEAAPLSPDAVAIKAQIDALQKSNAKLDGEARAARKENVTLRQKLSECKPGTPYIYEMCAAREKAAEELERLRKEKDDVIRGLRAKIETLESGTEGQLQRELKVVTDTNRMLARQVNELSGLKTAGIYDALLRVASVMGQVSKDSDGSHGMELKNRVSELVDLTLAGNGLTPAQLSERRGPVYSGLFAAYSRAARNEQESYAAQLVAGKGKRPRA